MDEDYARKLRAWLRAEPGATPQEEREWLREVPAPAERISAPQPDSDESWSVRGQLPAAEPEAGEEWMCPVIVLPIPRSSQENGCRMSGAEARSRRNHPSGRLREEAAESRVPGEADRSRAPEGPAEPRRLSEAEARSRWNHPSSWHRRRRQQEEPGGR
jgi:hypothetical protein